MVLLENERLLEDDAQAQGHQQEKNHRDGQENTE
jgi:hypothetical protein